MGWTKEVWQKQVGTALFRLANIALQKELWRAKIPGYYSDFADATCELESCGIPEYLDDFIEDGYLEREQAQELIKLNDLIDQTGDEYSTNEEMEELWRDPLWLKIARFSGELFMKYYADSIKKIKPYSDWMEKWPLPVYKSKKRNVRGIFF